MTEYWDGTGVTVDNLTAEVRRLAEASPDYVYSADNFPADKGSGARCKYTHTLEDDSKVPGCIIGQAIFNITGTPVDQHIHGGGVTDFGFMREGWDANTGRWSNKAKFLANVQYHQDRQNSWGDAVKLADDRTNTSNWWTYSSDEDNS